MQQYEICSPWRLSAVDLGAGAVTTPRVPVVVGRSVGSSRDATGPAPCWSHRRWTRLRPAAGAPLPNVHTSHRPSLTIIRVGIAGGGVDPPPPVHVYRRSFLSENRFKISITGQNFKHFDIGLWPQVLSGQFQHWLPIINLSTNSPMPAAWPWPWPFDLSWAYVYQVRCW